MSDERQHDSRYTQMVESSILNKVEINFTRRRALPGVLPAGVQRLVANSLSDATKRAYALDIAHFEGTGRSLPAAPETVAEYLAECAETYAVATLQRRLASVSKAHRALGADDPTKSELVRATMRGVRRTLGVKQRQAQALLRDDLFASLDRIGERAKDHRDRALLLLGWACALRRSELVALNVKDIAFTAQGALVTVKRSKTDQEGPWSGNRGAFGRTRHCAIAALKTLAGGRRHRQRPDMAEMDKHGNIFPGRISGEAVTDVV